MNLEDLQNYLSEYSKLISAYETEDLEKENLSERKQSLDYNQLESVLNNVNLAIIKCKKMEILLMYGK